MDETAPDVALYGRWICRTLAGWPGVEWSVEQTDEFVGRFEAFRRKRQGQADSS